MFLEKIPWDGIARSHHICLLKFIKNRQTFPKWLSHFIFPLAKPENSSCSTWLETLGIISLFNLSPSNECAEMFHWFKLALLDDHWHGVSSHVCIGHSSLILWSHLCPSKLYCLSCYYWISGLNKRFSGYNSSTICMNFSQSMGKIIILSMCLSANKVVQAW